MIGIYNTSGNKVVEYAYDAFGNCTVLNSWHATLAYANPIRYRGYYYDIETGFYYLNARYYNPEWRRFISPDDTAYLNPQNVNGLNLYCYCNNDPINFVDPSGHSIVAALLITLGIIGIASGLGYAAHTDYQDDYDINGSIGLDYLWLGIIGGAIGAGIGFGIGYFGPAILASAGTAISSLATLGAGGSLALAGGGVQSLALAQVLTGTISIGIIIYSISTNGSYGGYWAVKHPGDHTPNHVHLKGTDGTDIRIGENGFPLEGEPSLTAQQKKALKRLWKEICEKLFPWG